MAQAGREGDGLLPKSMVKVSYDGKVGQVSNLRDDDRQVQSKEDDKSRMRVIGAVFVIVLLLSLLGAVIYLELTYCDCMFPHGTERLECTTAGCLEVAAFMVQAMNTSVDPCDNFYQYACGNWVEHVGKVDEPVDVSHALELVLEQKWHELLVAPIVRADENSSERKLKQFFSMCLDDFARGKDKARGLVDIIINSNHSWYGFDPIGWSSSWSVEDAIAAAHKNYLVPFLFDYSVWPDNRNVHINILTVLPAYLGMAEDDYMDDGNKEIHIAYKTYINTLAGFLLRDANETLLGTEKSNLINIFTDDVMAIETEIAQMKIRAGSDSWTDAVPTPLGEFGNNYTGIDYIGLFTDLFADSYVNVSSEVLVRAPLFFHFLDDWLKERNSTTDRQLNNYLTWSLVSQTAEHLSYDYQFARRLFIEKREGRTKFDPTWDSCMGLVKSRFTAAMATLFYKTHINDDPENMVDDITAHIRAMITHDINSFDWMDEVTKSEAKDKISRMDVEAGFPPQFRHANESDHVYHNLVVDPDLSFFQNLMNLNEFIVYQAGQHLLSSYEDNLWRYEVLHDGYGVRPFYYWIYNSIMIPPGALTFPIFESNVPFAYNYGTIGTRISNAMIHSIDSIGRMMANGTTHLWWSDASYQQYVEARQCFFEYYDGLVVGPYVIDGEEKYTHIEGTSYSVKVVARTAGLRIAFKTYADLGAQNAHLPGLNMTNDQLFFLTAAQTRCAKEPDEEAYHRAVSGHLPEEQLYNGIVSHSEDFQNVFNCPIGSTMNPETKCKIF